MKQPAKVLRIIARVAVEELGALAATHVVVDCDQRFIAWLGELRAVLSNDPRFYATQYFSGVTMFISDYAQPQKLQDKLARLDPRGSCVLLASPAGKIESAGLRTEPASLFVTKTGFYWETQLKNSPICVTSDEVPWEALDSWRAAFEGRDREKKTRRSGVFILHSPSKATDDPRAPLDVQRIGDLPGVVRHHLVPGVTTGQLYVQPVVEPDAPGQVYFYYIGWGRGRNGLSDRNPTRLVFQRGLPSEGLNGITDEAVLAVLIDRRLRNLVHCSHDPDEAEAHHHLCRAMECLKRVSARRVAGSDTR